MHRAAMRLTWKSLAALVGSAQLSAPVFSASFDCEPYFRQRMCPQSAICRNRDLFSADSELSEKYSRIVRRVAEGYAQRLGASLKTWLAQRDVCGCDIECLSRSYQHRLLDLDRQLGLPPTYLSLGLGDSTEEEAVCKINMENKPSKEGKCDVVSYYGGIYVGLNKVGGQHEEFVQIEWDALDENNYAEWNGGKSSEVTRIDLGRMKYVKKDKSGECWRGSAEICVRHTKR